MTRLFSFDQTPPFSIGLGSVGLGFLAYDGAYAGALVLPALFALLSLAGCVTLALRRQKEE